MRLNCRYFLISLFSLSLIDNRSGDSGMALLTSAIKLSCDPIGQETFNLILQ